MQTIKLAIKAGQIRAIHNDALTPIFDQAEKVEIKRASHVEPVGKLWYADLAPVAGPFLGPFPTRQLALAAEVAYLDKRIISNNGE